MALPQAQGHAKAQVPLRDPPNTRDKDRGRRPPPPWLHAHVQHSGSKHQLALFQPVFPVLGETTTLHEEGQQRVL